MAQLVVQVKQALPGVVAEHRDMIIAEVVAQDRVKQFAERTAQFFFLRLPEATAAVDADEVDGLAPAHHFGRQRVGIRHPGCVNRNVGRKRLTGA